MASKVCDRCRGEDTFRRIRRRGLLARFLLPGSGSIPGSIGASIEMPAIIVPLPVPET